MNGFQVISEQTELKADTDFCIKEFFTNTEKNTYSVTVIPPPNRAVVESLLLH